MIENFNEGKRANKLPMYKEDIDIEFELKNQTDLLDKNTLDLIDKLFVIHMQIIEDSQIIELSENILNDFRHKLHLNLDGLDDKEKQIAGLLQSGYTQQAISKLLITSRSSIVRKIRTICKKMRLIKIT